MNQTELNFTSIKDIIRDRKNTYLNEAELKRHKEMKKSKPRKKKSNGLKAISLAILKENKIKKVKTVKLAKNIVKWKSIELNNDKNIISGEDNDSKSETKGNLGNLKENGKENGKEEQLDIIDDALDFEFKAENAGPKMKIENGKIVIDEESLFIKTAPKARSDYEILESERKIDGILVKRKRYFMWKQPEEDKFFQALRLFGTDFGMMAGIFPGRDRKDLKKKYQKEEKQNPDKVEFSLKNPLPIGNFEAKDFNFDGEEEGKKISN